MPIIDLMPLDSVGMELNRPGHMRKWGLLNNVAFRDGSLVPRPGFKEAYSYSNLAISLATVEPRPATALIELYNPGSSDEGRVAANVGWVTETIRPNGTTVVVAGWTASGAATVHECIDEAVPEDTPTNIFAYSTTAGAQSKIDFASPAVVYTDILGVRVGIRARVVYTGGDCETKCKLYTRSGSTNTEFANFIVNAFDVDETTFFYDYSFMLEKNPSTGLAWVQADLAGLNVVIEHTGGTSGISFALGIDTLDSTTNWLDNEDGGAAAVADITLVEETFPTIFPALNQYSVAEYASPSTGNKLTSSTANATLHLSFDDIPAGVTMTAIDRVEVLFRVTAPANTSIGYELYHNNGTTDTLVTSGSAGGGCTPYSFPVFGSMTTHPTASETWTKTLFNASSFKFKILEAKTTIVEYVHCEVVGRTNVTRLEIDKLEAEIMAPGTSAVRDKIVCSNKSFVRYQPEDRTIDDVTNSVASTSYPSIVPFDHAELFGQTYIVNGVDNTKRYPNSSSLFESLTTNNADGATPITGRTVCAFANRILYGWTKENATYTPERVAYSKISNGGTHNAVTAGDFDIIDTMGGVVALRALNESVAFCGKEVGIYTLRRTGNSVAPIIVDPVDYETRCLSMSSAVRALVKGVPMILFYGFNPTAGLNIYAFDGSSVQPVGDAINPMLEEYVNPIMNSIAVAGINPRDNSYVIFFAAGREIERSKGFAMNLNTLAWTKWELPYSVYSTGIWDLPHPTGFSINLNAAALAGEAFPGLPTMMVGGRNNLALQAHILPYDSLTLGDMETTPATGHTFEQIGTLDQHSVFTSTIETGDIQFVDPQAGEVQTLGFRVHLDYRNFGPVRLEISASTDGGATYTTPDAYHIGDMKKDGSARHALLDLDTSVNDRKIRFKIEIEPADATWEVPFFWQIDRIFIEYQTAGINGP